MELPELPPPYELVGYTTDQVREIQRAAAQAALDAAAGVAEAYEPRCDFCPSGVANAIRAIQVQP